MIVTVHESDALSVHTFTAEEAGWRANCHLLEFGSLLVLVDAPLRTVDADRVRAEIERLGKPLDRVIITHPHPDHFATAAQFRVPVHALEPVAKAVIAGGAQQIAAAYALSGLAVADEPAAPAADVVIEPGPASIDGVEVEFRRVDGAEAYTQLVVWVPSESVLITGDLAYAGVHAFLAGRQLDGWRAALADLPAAQVVLPGHGVPDANAVPDTAAYLDAAATVLAEAADAADLGERLDAAFPGHGGRAMRPLQNYFLFPKG